MNVDLQWVPITREGKYEDGMVTIIMLTGK